MKRTILILSGIYSMLSFGIDIKNEDSYLVQKGDTLWDISDHFLENPWEWTSIWENNPQIKNPNLIYPDDQISLIYRDGIPLLIIEKDTIVKTLNLNKEVQEIEAPSYELSDKLPMINVKKIKDFEQSFFVSEFELEDRIVSSYSDSLIHFKGDKVYIHSKKEHKIGDVIQSYKLEENIEDIGFIYQKTGDLKITNIDEDIYTAQIISNTVEISLKNYIGNIEMFNENEDIYATKTKKGLKTKIAYVPTKAKAVKNDIVILPVGSNDSIKVGNVLEVITDGKEVEVGVEKIKIKSERMGLILVYKVEKNFSYAIIVKNNVIITKDNTVVSPF